MNPAKSDQARASREWTRLVDEGPAVKIAICNETFRDWTHDDAFRLASELGYEGVEIAPFTISPITSDITDDMCRELARLARGHRLEIVGLHWLLAGTRDLHLTSPEEAVRAATARYLIRLVEICAELEGQVMVLGSPRQRNLLPDVSTADGMRFAADCLARIVPSLGRHGITLAIEPLGPEEGNFLTTAADARSLVAMLDSHEIRLQLDVKAMAAESLSIPEIIRASRRELVHFHCNDPNRRGPGMGKVDYAPIIAALREVGYDGWLSVEVFDETISGETMARTSIEYLRAQLASRVGDNRPRM